MADPRPSIHLVQLDIAWENPGANRARAGQLLGAAPVRPGDLVLLPEMFATGFSFNVPGTNDASGATLGWMSSIAQELRVMVHGGRTLLAPTPSLGLNVATVVDDAGGVCCEYTKVHPFPTEVSSFEPGRAIGTYAWAGLKVMPAICYDLRFPELFRSGLEAGAEAFALGACWPTVRQHHWRALLIARAIENQAFVFGCNRVGTEPGVLGQTVVYTGGSIVVSPRGEVLGELGPSEGVLSVPIDIAELRDWRRTFRAWRDRRWPPPPTLAPDAG